MKKSGIISNDLIIPEYLRVFNDWTTEDTGENLEADTGRNQKSFRLRRVYNGLSDTDTNIGFFRRVLKSDAYPVRSKRRTHEECYEESCCITDG